MNACGDRACTQSAAQAALGLERFRARLEELPRVWVLQLFVRGRLPPPDFTRVVCQVLERHPVKDVMAGLNRIGGYDGRYDDFKGERPVGRVVN